MFLALGATSCTVPTYGITGVVVDNSGRLTAALSWCDGHPPDTLIVYFDGPGRSSIDVGRFSVTGKLTGTYTEVPLQAGQSGWKADIPLPPALDPARTYHMYGGTKNNSSSTSTVTFTVASLRGLPPGSIRIISNREEVNQYPALNVDRAEFQRQVHRQFDC
jgi:hypothetical protein